MLLILSVIILCLTLTLTLLPSPLPVSLLHQPHLCLLLPRSSVLCLMFLAFPFSFSSICFPSLLFSFLMSTFSSSLLLGVSCCACDSMRRFLSFFFLLFLLFYLFSFPSTQFSHLNFHILSSYQCFLLCVWFCASLSSSLLPVCSFLPASRCLLVASRWWGWIVFALVLCVETRHYNILVFPSFFSPLPPATRVIQFATSRMKW